jgi:hypothetical protein
MRKRKFIMTIEDNRVGRKYYVVKEVFSGLALGALTRDAVKTRALKLLRTLTGKRFPKKIRRY